MMSLTNQNLISLITEIATEIVVELFGEADEDRLIEVKHVDNDQLRRKGELGLKDVKETIKQEIFRKTPWAENKSGVVYPAKGRAIAKDIGRFRVVDGCVWKENEQPPPSEDGDFVERGLGHSQRVDTKSGHTIFKSKGFTIDVRTSPAEGDGRADQLAGDGEIVIQGKSGAKVIIDSTGRVKIIGAKVYLGAESTTPVFQAVLRNKDISKKPVLPGVPAFVQILESGPTTGSQKVGATD